MPRFKSWVRALLLAVYRRRSEIAAAGNDSGGTSEGSDATQGSTLPQHLAALPHDMLLRVVGQAAYPLSVWTPGAWAHVA